MSKPSNRRQFLKATSIVGASLALPELSQAATSNDIEWSALNNESRMPASQANWLAYTKTHRVPYEGIVTSLKSEQNYVCQVRGQLPRDLSGSLFRAGPGLFDRAGMRRRMQIDADGMIRHFRIANGQAVFSNKHVRTQKFQDEEKAGRYIYPSFSQHVPRYNLMFTNSVARVKNQASVCAFVFGGKLFVTDEIQALTQLRLHDLSTVGEVSLTGSADTKFMAHYRITHFGAPKLHLTSYDPLTGHLQVLTFNEQFKIIEKSIVVKVSRSFHDWHATQDYFVFMLPPLQMSNTGLAKAVAGFGTVADAIEFHANQKAQILVIPRNGRPPRLMTLPDTLDSWHSVNAYQTADFSKIVFDFVASTKRDPIASNKSVMTRIMRGEVKQDGSLRKTSVYRAILDYTRNHITYGRDHFNLHGVEMPTVDARLYGKAHTNAYFIAGQDAIDTQLVRLDTRTGEQDRYDFGPNQFVTEPIFAPSTTSAGGGYLLSEVYSYTAKRSYLAVFDGFNLSRGPLAEIWLRHHLPIGFHGFWHAG